MSRLHEDTYIPGGNRPCTRVTEAFPIAEVGDWSRVVENGEPAIHVVIRFASDPIAPRVSVELTIGYRESVDGTENLVYRIRSIREKKLRTPRGAEHG